MPLASVVARAISTLSFVTARTVIPTTDCASDILVTRMITLVGVRFCVRMKSLVQMIERFPMMRPLPSVALASIKYAPLSGSPFGDVQ